MKKQKLFLISAWLGIALGTILIGVTTFWTLYPYKPAEVTSIKILDEKVKAGSIFHYQIDYCKYLNKPAEVSRALVDGVVFTLNTITTNNKTGCHTNTMVINIPPEMPSGVYSLKTTWIYKVNPIRDVEITFNTDTFQIIANDLDKESDLINH